MHKTQCAPICQWIEEERRTRMWANARDGRPAVYRWRPPILADAPQRAQQGLSVVEITFRYRLD